MALGQQESSMTKDVRNRIQASKLPAEDGPEKRAADIRGSFHSFHWELLRYTSISIWWARGLRNGSEINDRSKDSPAWGQGSGSTLLLSLFTQGRSL